MNSKHPYISIAQEQIDLHRQIQRLINDAEIDRSSESDVLERINAAIREHMYISELERH